MKNFAELYDANCIACHSNGKTVAASIGLNNPVYLAVAPKEVLQKVIAEGIPGKPMPGFSKAKGGELTDEQINILADGISAWGKGETASELPPYAAAPGDAQRGESVFTQNCAGCHGKAGTGDKAGSVVDGTYLTLVSDQYLRSVVIGGRPELGMPNYREDVKGTPMTPDQISDVVAWLISHRPSELQDQKAASAGPQPAEGANQTTNSNPQ
jgi:mono/diheme cytochrome c family protein